MSQLPMSTEEFFDVFRSYNLAFWPAPLAWTIAALLMVWVAVRSGRDAGLPARPRAPRILAHTGHE